MSLHVKQYALKALLPKVPSFVYTPWLLKALFFSSRTLNFNNSPLYIGGVNGPDALLERPGQVHSDDLVGCVHSVAIGGRALNLSSPIKARSVSNTCPRFAARTMCSAAKSHLSFVASAEDGSDVLQACIV